MSRTHPEGCVRLDVLLRRWGIAGKRETRGLAALGRPAALTVSGAQSALITVTEGKYHEVKRLIRACGARVAFLRRISIGGLALDPALPIGNYRPLRPEELAAIFEEGPAHAK